MISASSKEYQQFFDLTFLDSLLKDFIKLQQYCMSSFSNVKVVRSYILNSLYENLKNKLFLKEI